MEAVTASEMLLKYKWHVLLIAETMLPVCSLLGEWSCNEKVPDGGILPCYEF